MYKKKKIIIELVFINVEWYKLKIDMHFKIL